jgi:hypothetical protein
MAMGSGRADPMTHAPLLPPTTPELTKLLNPTSSATDYSDEVFTNRIQSKSCKPTPGTDDELQTDYGIAIKCSNPYRVDKRVVIVYGAYDSGTKGAMDYITNATTLRELLTAVGSNNNLWVLVKATVEKRKVVDFQKAAHGTLTFLPQKNWPKEDSFDVAQCPQYESTE